MSPFTRLLALPPTHRFEEPALLVTHSRGRRMLRLIGLAVAQRGEVLARPAGKGFALIVERGDLARLLRAAFPAARSLRLRPRGNAVLWSAKVTQQRIAVRPFKINDDGTDASLCGKERFVEV